MNSVVKILGRILFGALGLVAGLLSAILNLLAKPAMPLVRRVDSSAWLSERVDSLSSAMATQRGLPIIIGTGLIIVSFVTHGLVIVLLVMTDSFDFHLYWLCLPFTLMHVGVLIGFTGTMLATPLGQGYKDK